MVDPIILSNLDAPPGPLTRSTQLFFHYLEYVIERPGTPTEFAIIDFALHLFGLLGYDEPDCVIHRQVEVGFLMDAVRVNAKLYICILDDKGYVLLVLKNKHL